MTTRLRRIPSDVNPGYRVEVDGEHAGDVFATPHPTYPSITLWYNYLPGQDFPGDPELTRRESVDALVDVYHQEQAAGS